MVGVNHKEAKKRLQEVIVDSKSKSLRAFALSINIDPSLLAKVVGDQRTLTPAMVKAITEKYKINEDWLLYGKGEKYGQNGTQQPVELPPDLPVLDRLMKQLESRADELKADKERLYGIIENYLNSILSNTQANQEQLKILRTQADIVIKQIAHQDEAILRTQLQKNEIVKGGRDKSGK